LPRANTLIIENAQFAAAHARLLPVRAASALRFYSSHKTGKLKGARSRAPEAQLTITTIEGL
jgi:hypothetical protein